MITIKTFELEAGHRFENHPHFTYVIDDKLYMWRYDIERQRMLNQATGIDNSGKTLEEGLTELLAKRSDSPSIINEKYITNCPGKIYHRIWRVGTMEKNLTDTSEPSSNINVLTQAVTTSSILIKNLFRLFETIEPTTDNFDSYGHEIRNLLLLACMEVETNFVGILEANGNIKPRMNTTDYIKLKDPLQLTDYQIKFEFYPELPIFEPFKGWNAGSPTQTLGWYHAYNKTKHNREQELKSATLNNTIESISGLLAILYAQFGPYHKFWSEYPLNNINITKTSDLDVEHFYIPHNEDKTKLTEWELMNLTV